MKTGFNSQTDFLAGAVLLIDKPLDWSSFDVVKKVRNTLCRKFSVQKIKVGHAGTLDPLATGLIIICTGKATRQIESYQEMEKEYVANLKLGESTPSFDLETEVDRHYPTEHINMELVKEAMERMKGKSIQVPPVFSAKRFGGKRAYHFAREGKELRMRPQAICISELELLSLNVPELKIRISCSKGTYIRSVARDLGTALQSGAYITALRRTRIGDYSVKSALTPEKFTEKINFM